MTIKEAFEKLAATCSAGMKNPFFIMRNLHDAFADIAGKIEGGGAAENITYDNTDSGLTADDVQGAIDELADDVSNILGPIDYSETEQDTGRKWIDGKKIYVKTIHDTISSAMKNNWYSYAHGILNIDKVIDYRGIFFNGNVTYMNSITPTNSNSGDGNVNGKNVFNIISCNQTNMVIQLGNNYTVGDDIYFTIYYTKSES